MVNRRESGFTLVEVVIVMAIAGLIFATAFLAIRQVQVAQRDNHRKNDLAALAGQIEQYAVNNRGSYPLNSNGTFHEFKAGFWRARENPATGETYDLQYITVSALTDPPDPDEIYYDGSNAKCSVGGGIPFEYHDSINPSLQVRKYALVIGLEAGGYHCLDNR